MAVSAAADVEVVAQRAVAFVGASLDDVLDVLAAAPDVLPILVGDGTPEGYERVESLANPGGDTGRWQSNPQSEWRDAITCLTGLRADPRGVVHFVGFTNAVRNIGHDQEVAA